MKQTYRRLLLLLSTRLTSPLSPFRNVSSRAAAYCSTTTTTTTTLDETRRNPAERAEADSLYRRLSPLGSPNVSIIPVLDKWVDENRSVNDANIRFIIKQLRHYRRFKHALELSKWMSEKRFTLVSAADTAIRLDLIAKVHGVEAAEDYFNNTSQRLRSLEVYGALLNCYAEAKYVDKAEAVFQNMRDLGFARYSMSHNVMLNLYCRTGNREKLNAMLNEMEVKKIKFDSFTYSILLNTYGGDCDIDGIERTLTKMESDHEVDIDWMTYAVAAKQFLKANSVEKALESIRKSEKLVAISKKKNEAYSFILSLYSTARKKEEVLRVWNKCKMYKVTNKDYMSLMRSLLKFRDMKTAEMIFNEWQNSNLVKDIRIPNFLISTYCEKGMIKKAEALLERVKSGNWQKPDSVTWYWMSYAYVKSNQMPKAVEALELALSELYPITNQTAGQEILVACLNYLKDEGELERRNAIVHSRAIPDKIHEKLIEYTSGKCGVEDVFK